MDQDHIPVSRCSPHTLLAPHTIVHPSHPHPIPHPFSSSTDTSKCIPFLVFVLPYTKPVPLAVCFVVPSSPHIPRPCPRGARQCQGLDVHVSVGDPVTWQWIFFYWSLFLHNGQWEPQPSLPIVLIYMLDANKLPACSLSLDLDAREVPSGLFLFSVSIESISPWAKCRVHGWMGKLVGSKSIIPHPIHPSPSNLTTSQYNSIHNKYKKQIEKTLMSVSRPPSPLFLLHGSLLLNPF